MTQDKIEKIIDDNIIEHSGEIIIHCDWAAKEIYKLHLEAQLELLHTVNDAYYDTDLEMEKVINIFTEELETKLKELG